jgi:uncharacterized membrane protein
MTTIKESIDIAVPVRAAYNQWTQFEDFPRFMEGVKSVTQMDDTHLRWVAAIAGIEREWTAEIIEQVPDQRIKWATHEGEHMIGLVTFEDITGGTRVTLTMEYQPHDLTEKAGDTLGFVRRRVQGDLERFKAFIEEREIPTGEWRGEVQQGMPRGA